MKPVDFEPGESWDGTVTEECETYPKDTTVCVIVDQGGTSATATFSRQMGVSDVYQGCHIQGPWICKVDEEQDLMWTAIRYVSKDKMRLVGLLCQEDKRERPPVQTWVAEDDDRGRGGGGGGGRPDKPFVND